MITLLVGLIIFFGIVNLIRMAVFIVSNNIYDTKKAHLDNEYKRHLLRDNRVRTQKVLNRILLSVMRFCRSLLLRIGNEMYEIHPGKIKQLRDSYRPLVSVVVPAYNEERVIIRNLESLFASSYSKLEVIVADDGSTDKTNELVKKFKRLHPEYNLRILKLKNKGKAAALNTAISKHTRGKLVMCLDADSMIAPESIANGVKYFKDRNLEALSSNVKIIDDGSLLSLVQKFEYIICYEMKKAQTVLNVEYIIGGIGSMFRKSALAKVDWYDTNTMTEDIDVTMKILRQGTKKHRVAYAADMIALTESAQTIKDLIKQRYRWKYGRLQTFYKNKSMFFSNKKIHHKALTWVYLPYAIYGEIAFMMEPLIISFMLITSLLYADTLTFYGAYLLITGYVAFNVIGDQHSSVGSKIQMLLISPAMYLLFFVLSFVEYAALIKSIANLPKLKTSVSKPHGSWGHVKRTGVSISTNTR